MEKTTLAAITLVALSAVVAAVAHWRIRSFPGACAAASLAATALFQVITFIELGHFDAFMPVAVVVGALWALAVAVPVGLVIRAIRSWRGRGR